MPSIQQEIVLRSAKADDPVETIATLIWSTDPPLMTHLFGSLARFQRVAAHDWPQAQGIVSHTTTALALCGPDVVGVIVSNTLDVFDAHFAHTKAHQAEREDPAFRAHLTAALGDMDRLFPDPEPGSYYVLDLAVAPEAQGIGVGRKLMNHAKSQARAAGCSQVCLDVAANNAAVAFYRRIGMEVAVETRLPRLDAEQGIGRHYHMTMKV